MNDSGIGTRDLELRCAKCLATGVALEYRRAKNVNGSNARVECLPECPDGEHFDCFCKRCGFGWPEGLTTETAESAEGSGHG